MSHFGMAVVLRTGEKPTLSEAHQMVEVAFAPFSEHIERDDGTRQHAPAKWDWWQIGGRYTGRFSDYDPRKDPQNIKVCGYCQGTGKRKDIEIANVGCNVCLGTGKAVEWPTQWAENAGDIVLVRDALATGHQLFGVLTPDGRWTDGEDQPGYSMPLEVFRAALSDYPDHWMVVVDCHS